MEESETPSTLYGNAVYGWSLRQAELLRAGHYDDVGRRAALFACYQADLQRFQPATLAGRCRDPALMR